MVAINSVHIQKEFRKSSSLRQEDINELKEWHSRQKHLPKIYDSDYALFLFSNYYCLDATKMSIENYFTLRTNTPEFFSNQNLQFSKDLLRVFDKVNIIPLERKTRENYKVILVRLIEKNLSPSIYNDVLKILNMVLDLCIYLEGTQRGHICVFDINGADLSNANTLCLNSLTKFSDYLQNIAPIRWNGLHYINTSLDYEKIEDFVKLKIVKNKYVSAIYFHSSLDSLNEIVPQDALPNEMGGRAGYLTDLQNTEIEALKNYSWWFLSLEILGKVETNLRTDGKCVSITDNFVKENEIGKLGIA